MPQRKKSYWDVGCLQNEHWIYYENCPNCLEKAGYLMEYILMDQAHSAMLAEIFNDFATGINNSSQGRRKSTAEHGIEGFARGMAIGLGMPR
jgi:hypothetical protein